MSTRKLSDTILARTGSGPVAAATLLLLVATTASAQIQLAKLAPGDPVAHDTFGTTVAISGNTVVVGAFPFEDDPATSRVGAAYVFVGSGTSWTQQAKLTASGGVGADGFGVRVSISGDTVVVGALFSGPGAAGAAYLFVKPPGGWDSVPSPISETAKLTASDGATGDLFGSAVSVDGDTVVVGAERNTDVSVGGATNNHSGSAYVFVKPGTGWSGTLNETAKLSGSGPSQSNARRGINVSVSGDTVLVAAPFDSAAGEKSGAVFVFEKPLGGWVDMTETAKLTASDAAAFEKFGFATSLDGNTAVLGNFQRDPFPGKAYVFERVDGTWEQVAKLTASDGAPDDIFGFFVSVSGDVAVIGAAGDDNEKGSGAGSAYMFLRGGGSWSEQTKFTACDGAALDQLARVAVDGGTIVVGAKRDDDPVAGADSGSAYIFSGPLDLTHGGLTFTTSESPFGPGRNQGWWSPSSPPPGIVNKDSNDNYALGSSECCPYGTFFRQNNFFTFDLSRLSERTAVSATLRLTRAVSFDSDNEAQETIEFFDVFTDALTLNKNEGTNTAIFDDLGSGTSYGAFEVPGFSFDRLEVLEFVLNAEAVADINTAARADLPPEQPRYFSIGGTLASFSAGNMLFGLSQDSGVQELVVELAALAAESDCNSIAFGELDVAFPPGTQALGGGLNNIEIRFVPGPLPKVELGNVELPAGQTKTVTMPIGIGDFLCINDSPNATLETLAGIGCTTDCAKGIIGIKIPVAGGTTTVDCTSETGTQYVITTNLTGDRITITGLLHTAIEMRDTNKPPTAVAGSDQSIHAGQTVLLNGSASFDDNTDDLLLAWSFASTNGIVISGRPEGSTATLSGAATTTPSFVADVTGTYFVQLIVTDEEGVTSAADEVVISSTNIAPTARAGDDVGGVVGFVTTLDGIGSTDPEEDPLTFAWSLVQTPAGSLATLDGADTDMPSFVPDVEGVYVLSLVVNDGLADSLPDEVEVTVITGDDFAENTLMDLLDFVANLSPDRVTTTGNQRALTNFLSQAIRAIQLGNIELALFKIDEALERTDGCVLRGGPDGNGPGRDWITDCVDQVLVYTLLIVAKEALSL